MKELRRLLCPMKGWTMMSSSNVAILTHDDASKYEHLAIYSKGRVYVVRYIKPNGSVGKELECATLIEASDVIKRFAREEAL